jgi:indolepyruvate decarboxylase
MTINYEANLGQQYCQQLPTLGQTMADVIKFFGGNRIYGVGGDFAANIISALERDIEICPSSNEMHAGFSACAQAELTGVGFCLTTYMVGSLPCASAAALAVTEGLPVIFISGAPGEQEVNHSAIHHTIHPTNSWKAEYDNALEAFSALGMRVERLQGQRTSGQPNIAGDRFFQLVAHAYQTKQPVFIEVPRDQVFAKTQLLQLPDSAENICCGTTTIAGAPLVAQEIISKLTNSSHPVLFIGDRLKHNNKLKPLMVEFAHKFNIPYATTWFAKGLFDEHDPLCLGCYNGIFTNDAERNYIESSMDYVLDVASSIFSQDTNSAFATGTHFIEKFNNKTIIKGTELLEKDLIDIFELLLIAEIPHYQFNNEQRPPAVINDNEAIDFHNLAQVLNQLQQRDTSPYVYFPEVGNSYFCSYSLKTRMSSLGRSWLTNPWYGAMGTSLPYARVAAQLVNDSHSDDRVVVITGDGGFHFQLNELIHLMKDQSAVTIIYMRNNIFHLGKSSDAPIYRCNDQDFDVNLLVKAYGGESKLCTKVSEFKQYFSDAMDDNQGIKLIEIPAQPSEERQCREIRLLNLYIKAKNGDPSSQEQWDDLCCTD